jgi:predicted dehydrogenase
MALQNRSRRHFLNTSAGSVLATASAIRKVMGSNDRVRVGFIGVGLIGQRHLLDFRAQPDVEIAAICEVYPPRLAEGMALSMGEAQGFKDFRKMLELKNLDAVVISTPDHWHALMTIMACAAGKDVYVEKPLTHVVREGSWMIQAMKSYRRVVQVGTQQRSGRHYQECVGLVRKGHIGELHSARISSYRNVMPGFTRPVAEEPLTAEEWDQWLGPAPFVPFDRNRSLYHFRWFWDYSGGQTTNLLSHDLDIVQWITESVPEAVTAVGGRFSLKGIGETPDVVEAVFKYTNFLTSWSCRENCSHQGFRNGDGLELYGTKGTLAINRRGFEIFPDLLSLPEEQIPQFTNPQRPPPALPLRYRTTPLRRDGFEELRDQFQPHIRNFLDCVKSRRQPISDLESGHRTATACHLANLSMKTGRTLYWDAVREELLKDPEASRLLTKEYRPPWNQELKSALPKT